MDHNYFNNLSFPCPKELHLKFEQHWPRGFRGEVIRNSQHFSHHFSNFGRPLVPNDLCKDSAQRHPWFWRRRLYKVFTIYGHGGHLKSTVHNHFSNLLIPQLKEAPYDIWAKLAQQLQRKSRLNMLTDGWMDDGQKVITIAHPEHNSGELKISIFPRKKKKKKKKKKLYLELW